MQNNLFGMSITTLLLICCITLARRPHTIVIPKILSKKKEKTKENETQDQTGK